MLFKSLMFFLFTYNDVWSVKVKECSDIETLELDSYPVFIRAVIPNLDGKTKGEAGKIGILGGSTEYTGAPYFAAITALKVGADLVYVITTESAAPIIKSYSPDLIVYPFLSQKYASKINNLLSKMDLIIIGPGLGREDETMQLTNDVIQTCKSLKKPLVIDADGLYAISRNISIIKDYPSPGIILTPNHHEEKRLIQAIPSSNQSNWYNYWGDFVSVLVKGEKDEFKSSNSAMNWQSGGGGSGRRVGGQGDILAGCLGTFYNWALKSNLCENEYSIPLSQSVAVYAAAQFTRKCNAESFKTNGRSMTASDMLTVIHSAFESLCQ